MKKNIFVFVTLLFISNSAFSVEKIAENKSADTQADIALAQAVSESEQAAALAEIESEVAATTAENTEKETKAENEIPLNFEQEKKHASEGNPLFKLLLSFSILGIIGTGAFLFIKRYSLPKQAKFQTPIKVLQQHYLGPKKSVAIIHVAGESILIGITDHNISHLKTLALLDEELPAVANNKFDGVLSGMGDDKDFEETHEDEEFAIGGIKEVVARRLRNMRSIE